LVHFLVVKFGVWLEGFGGGRGACGEDLGVEFGGGVVADEFSRLVLWYVRMALRIGLRW
jgi:hypothetical protein